VALGMFGASNPAPAAGGSGCQTPLLSFTSSEQVNTKTNSMIFVNLPKTAVSFTQSVTGCVVVHLTLGATSNGLNQDLRIRAMIDGFAFKGIPSEVYLSSFNGATVEFIFPSVTVGPHTLNIQYRSDSGSDVFVSRTLSVVHYR